MSKRSDESINKEIASLEKQLKKDPDKALRRKIKMRLNRLKNIDRERQQNYERKVKSGEIKNVGRCGHNATTEELNIKPVEKKTTGNKYQDMADRGCSQKEIYEQMRLDNPLANKATLVEALPKVKTFDYKVKPSKKRHKHTCYKCGKKIDGKCYSSLQMIFENKYLCEKCKNKVYETNLFECDL